MPRRALCAPADVIPGLSRPSTQRNVDPRFSRQVRAAGSISPTIANGTQTSGEKKNSVPKNCGRVTPTMV